MAPVLIETLPLFIEDAARKPFRYGFHDCALNVANWGRVLTGIDGAADLRGRYRSRLGCARIIQRAGGLASLVGRCAAKVGMRAVDEAQRGDVGVIVARTTEGVDQLAAIRFDATRWAVLTPHGMQIGADGATVVGAWGLR